MANGLVKAIRGEGKIEYMGGDNPLQAQFIRLSDMHAACSFLSGVALSGAVDDNEYALGVVLELVAGELKDITVKLDEANAEICRVLNEKREVRS